VIFNPSNRALGALGDGLRARTNAGGVDSCGAVWVLGLVSIPDLPPSEAPAFRTSGFAALCADDTSVAAEHSGCHRECREVGSLAPGGSERGLAWRV
jgi:hypothetical protein